MNPLPATIETHEPEQTEDESLLLGYSTQAQLRPSEEERPLSPNGEVNCVDSEISDVESSGVTSSSISAETNTTVPVEHRDVSTAPLDRNVDWRVLDALVHLGQKKHETILQYFNNFQSLLVGQSYNEDIIAIFLRRFSFGLLDDGCRAYFQQWLNTSQWTVRNAQDCVTLLAHRVKRVDALDGADDSVFPAVLDELPEVSLDVDIDQNQNMIDHHRLSAHSATLSNKGTQFVQPAHAITQGLEPGNEISRDRKASACQHQPRSEIDRSFDDCRMCSPSSNETDARDQASALSVVQKQTVTPLPKVMSVPETPFKQIKSWKLSFSSPSSKRGSDVSFPSSPPLLYSLHPPVTAQGQPFLSALVASASETHIAGSITYPRSTSSALSSIETPSRIRLLGKSDGETHLRPLKQRKTNHNRPSSNVPTSPTDSVGVDF